MKTLYLECNMGAAGDMLMAALLELHSNPKEFLDKLNSIGIPNVNIIAQPSSKCGITGTNIKVKINGQEECSNEHEHAHTNTQVHTHTHSHTHAHNHAHNEHKHNSYENIEHLIGHLNISDEVKKNALDVYKLIAEAESHVHGVAVDKIHFHEVGEMDAVADIVGVCMLIEELAPDLIFVSPVNVGSGQVRCAHGILPVPAPAAAHILKNIPIYSDNTQGELCTPTGAALLKRFANDFCKMPEIIAAKIGYGLGKKDFEKANCLRAYLGNINNAGDEIVELVCNLDDMTPEAVAFAQQLLFEEGALEVYTAPVGMKKGRTGLLFSCLCRIQEKDKMLSLIFKHTATLGIREYTCRRYALQKEQTKIQTKFGTIRLKKSHGFGVAKSKLEYEDIAKIAIEKNKSIQEVLNDISSNE